MWMVWFDRVFQWYLRIRGVTKTQNGKLFKTENMQCNVNILAKSIYTLSLHESKLFWTDDEDVLYIYTRKSRVKGIENICSPKFFEYSYNYIPFGLPIKMEDSWCPNNLTFFKFKIKSRDEISKLYIYFL